MRALFVGLGSIGSRHVKNLKQLCPGIEMEAVRSSKTQLSEDVGNLISKQHFDMKGITGRYELCFITNPTHLHRDAIEQTMGYVDSYFIEKPIFQKDMTLPFDDGRPVYVAAPLRHTNLFVKLSQLLTEEKCLAVRAICSSYLPSWRPGTDYTKCYSAIKEQGGGVKLDLIHEWDYLKALFGEPEQIKQISGNVSDLEISSEDYAIYIATAGGIPISLHLDYFGKNYSRSCEVICEKGPIKADFLTGMIEHYSLGPIDCKEDGNSKYLREMAHYLEVASGEKSLNDGENAVSTLRLVLSED